MFEPREIASAVAALAFFPVLGWISLRYLRAAPDLPRRAEMIWGAKWGGLVFTAMLMGPLAIASVVVRMHAPYAFTTYGVSVLIGPLVLGSMHHRLKWQFTGTTLALGMAGHRLKGTPADLASMMQEPAEREQTRFERTGRWLLGAIWLFWLGMTLLVLLPLDQQALARKADDRLAIEAKQALSYLPLRDVVVDRHWNIWSPVMPVMVGPVFEIPEHPDASMLWLQMERDAPEAILRPAADAAEQFLQEHNQRGVWWVWVTARDEASLREFWEPQQAGRSGGR